MGGHTQLSAALLVAATLGLAACSSGDAAVTTNNATARGEDMPSSFDEFDPSNPLEAIISPDSLRGVDAQLRITDADALADSMADAGLDAAQVDMVRAGDISLDGYLTLSRLEVECVRAQGIETEDPRIAEFEYGLSSPTYGFAATAPGLTEDEITYRQISCQNSFTGAYAYLYEAKFLPSSEERLQRDIAAANAFILCAQEQGVTAPIESVEDEADMDIFYTWFATPETDVNCTFKP